MLHKKIIYILLFLCCFLFKGNINAQPQLSLILADSSLYVQDIYIFNKDTVFFNNRLKIVRTFNGGLTWDSVFFNPIIYKMDFLQDGHGTVGSLNGAGILTTNDFGSTWDTAYYSPMHDFADVQVIDSQSFLLSTFDGYVLRTNDNGMTWDSSTQYLIGGWPNYLKSFSFLSPSEGFLCGGANLTLYTSDSGASWNVQSVGSFFDISEVSFCNNLIGWAVDDEPHVNEHLAVTYDGGLNWYLPNVPPNSIDLLLKKFQSVNFLSSGVGLVVDFFSIYSTNDFGNTWFQIITNPSTSPQFTSVKLVSDSLAYIGGWGGIYKLTNFLTTGNEELTGGNEKMINVLPTIFSQNTIVKKRAASPNIDLAIFNVIGKEIYRTIITEELTTLNLDYLSKGIYIFKASNGKHQQIIKVIKT